MMDNGVTIRWTGMANSIGQMGVSIKAHMWMIKSRAMECLSGK